MAAGSGTLVLPERGVTVLTGANGAGKSRFIEAVAYGLWGKTLREEQPWREGEPGSLVVQTAAGIACRSVTAKGKKGVSWQGNAADTPSRTQELVSAAVPEYDFWRRTHVFSSSDAAHFSGATDGERKRVMELLLGLDVFDRAAEACSKELSSARSDEGARLRALLEAQGNVSLQQGVLDALGTYPEFTPSVAPVEPPRPGVLEDTTPLLLERRSSLLREQSELSLDTSRGDTVSELTQLHETHRRAHSRALAGLCSQCGEPWRGMPPNAIQLHLEEVAAQLVEARAERQTEQVRYASERQRLGSELVVVEQALESMRAALSSARERRAVHDAWAAQRATWDHHEQARRGRWQQGLEEHACKAEGVRLELYEARDALEAAAAEHALARTLVQELEATSAVLGLRGLRGHVLGHALDGVEHVANYWLRQLSPGASLQLRADGVGKIGLTLTGFAGGRYRAASTGQRRRVDAPLLLALAEVASAGAGGAKGTLWLDELFDGLDEGGQALVARALGELGESQSVVVVTHSAELARSIPAVQRLIVRDGAVETL